MIRPLIRDFDDKKGKQHNLQTILDHPVLSDMEKGAKAESVVRHWAVVLTFDTIIGNTDRHPWNWGIIVDKPPSTTSPGLYRVPVRFAPAYDNGTSLAYEQPEEHFARFDVEQYAQVYLKRPKKARHHMKWSLQDEKPLNFYDFMRRYVQEYPYVRQDILSRLDFTEGDMRDRVTGLLSIPVGAEARLTERRLDFTLALVMKRKELLLRALESL